MSISWREIKINETIIRCKLCTFSFLDLGWGGLDPHPKTKIFKALKNCMVNLYNKFGEKILGCHLYFFDSTNSTNITKNISSEIHGWSHFFGKDWVNNHAGNNQVKLTCILYYHLYEKKDGRCATFNIIKLELRRLLIFNNRYGTNVLAECTVQNYKYIWLCWHS